MNWVGHRRMKWIASVDAYSKMRSIRAAHLVFVQVFVLVNMFFARDRPRPICLRYLFPYVSKLGYFVGMFIYVITATISPEDWFIFFLLLFSFNLERFPQPAYVYNHLVILNEQNV